jgi:hypothetical protein
VLDADRVAVEEQRLDQREQLAVQVTGLGEVAVRRELAAA